jgi:hypothetical protein
MCFGWKMITIMKSLDSMKNLDQFPGLRMAGPAGSILVEKEKKTTLAEGIYQHTESIQSPIELDGMKRKIRSARKQTGLTE